MGKGYRSWAERREIIRAVIAESAPPPLATFGLSASEETVFRAEAARAVDALARNTSAFKGYYALPTARPFNFVIATSAAVIVGAAAAASYIYVHTQKDPAYPIYAALLSLSVVAAGWTIAGWITHRNTIRQNTNTMLFARFSQATFGEALHRFHCAFGFDDHTRVTIERVRELRASSSEDDWKAATSVGYLLNYFELISTGVIRGDLDAGIVKDNFRGVICYYHDKCQPFIAHFNRENPRVYEHLIKMRAHYREP